MLGNGKSDNEFVGRKFVSTMTDITSAEKELNRKFKKECVFAKNLPAIICDLFVSGRLRLMFMSYIHICDALRVYFFQPNVSSIILPLTATLYEYGQPIIRKKLVLNYLLEKFREKN